VDRICVLLADDHAEFLATAVRYLESEVNVVKTVGDGGAALEEATKLDPDVLVLDISMPVLSGIEAARKLRAAGCRAKIVFLTVHHDPDFARAAFDAGAVGYVVKDRLASDLMHALREVVAGQCFVSPTVKLERLSDACTKPPQT
jgi:DNA-binding NarL/FixJ family response regulator